MKIILIFVLYLLLCTKVFSSVTEDIILKFNKIENFKFKFIQTISGKDEKGECIILYPKKINCKYQLRFNKILISNGSSLVIKSEKNNQYYRYPLENTPLNLLLDKKFLIRKMKKLEAKILNNKYYLFSLKENNNSINLFFDKESLNLTGWQTEDIYQNLTITYIYDVEINKPVSKKIFELPKLN